MSLHLLNSVFSNLKHCSAYSTRDGITVVTPGNMHIEVVTKYFDEPAVLAALEGITSALRERVENAGQPLKVVNVPTSTGIDFDFKEEKPKDVIIGKVINVKEPGWAKAKVSPIVAEAVDVPAEGEVKVAKRGRPKKG